MQDADDPIKCCANFAASFPRITTALKQMPQNDGDIIVPLSLVIIMRAGTACFTEGCYGHHLDL